RKGAFNERSAARSAYHVPARLTSSIRRSRQASRSPDGEFRILAPFCRNLGIPSGQRKFQTETLPNGCAHLIFRSTASKGPVATGADRRDGPQCTPDRGLAAIAHGSWPSSASLN